MINRSRLSHKMFEEGWDTLIRVPPRVREEVHHLLNARLGWIFNRRESNGVTRRDLEPFSREMLEERLNRQQDHPLNGATGRYYDWDFKDTDIVLRFEVPSRPARYDNLTINLVLHAISVKHNGTVCKVHCFFEPWRDNPYGWTGRYIILSMSWA